MAGLEGRLSSHACTCISMHACLLTFQTGVGRWGSFAWERNLEGRKEHLHGGLDPTHSHVPFPLLCICHLASPDLPSYFIHCALPCLTSRLFIFHCIDTFCILFVYFYLYFISFIYIPLCTFVSEGYFLICCALHLCMHLQALMPGIFSFLNA